MRIRRQRSQVQHRLLLIRWYLSTLGDLCEICPLPQSAKDKLFAEHQEAVRKDVERAFGVLQSRFAIVRGPARNMDRAELGIVKACIILHNIIVEDERDSYDLAFEYEDVEDSTPEPRCAMRPSSVLCGISS